MNSYTYIHVEIHSETITQIPDGFFLPFLHLQFVSEAADFPLQTYSLVFLVRSAANVPINLVLAQDTPNFSKWNPIYANYRLLIRMKERCQSHYILI